MASHPQLSRRGNVQGAISQLAITAGFAQTVKKLVTKLTKKHNFQLFQYVGGTSPTLSMMLINMRKSWFIYFSLIILCAFLTSRYFSKEADLNDITVKPVNKSISQTNRVHPNDDASPITNRNDENKLPGELPQHSMRHQSDSKIATADITDNLRGFGAYKIERDSDEYTSLYSKYQEKNFTYFIDEATKGIIFSNEHPLGGVEFIHFDIEKAQMLTTQDDQLFYDAQKLFEADSTIESSALSSELIDLVIKLQYKYNITVINTQCRDYICFIEGIYKDIEDRHKFTREIEKYESIRFTTVSFDSSLEGRFISHIYMDI
ncbi:hypothetical protein EXT46_07510 [Pseudoalteromonas sp. CO325X]|uniref:hypothetical protein n=1 Tax=Pseudoalteromonas sp. CO325X TaxID=1777262 RepID=UPI001023206F|nr:hypothetical protein [Pseudoalteromonas sp. CO325X]RZF83279.1 hypothetical protein EXT46_07510 [Pseudoalteromonas sp. CO325X]